MDIVHIIFWFSGVLLITSEWQLEIIRIRATRKELFSMPFFISVDRSYRTSSTVFFGTMLFSYMMALATNGVGLSWSGVILFVVGFWQLAEIQFKTVSGEPYKPPFFAVASEEIKMDKGTKKLNRLKHVSFWGDMYLLMIFIEYVITFL